MADINWSNITTAQDLLNAPNLSVAGYFWVGIMFMFWVIMITLMLNFGLATALLTASFICFLLSIILVYMQLMAWTWALFYFGVLILCVFWIYYNQN